MSDTLYEVPTCRLSTGLVVANFNSPHAFNFTDGSVLAACSNERAMQWPLEQVQRTIVTYSTWKGISYDYNITDALRQEILRCHVDVQSDLIIAPFPVLKVLRVDPVLKDYPFLTHRFVGIKNADRVTKAVFHNIFVVA